MRTEAAELRAAVREILIRDWDPSDVAARPEAHGAYDSYLDPLMERINSGADADSIIDFLKEREAESMCFPSLGTRRLARVAEKLLALRSLPNT